MGVTHDPTEARGLVYYPHMRTRLLVLLLVLAATPVFAKTLHWRALDVTARLDHDGKLHVSERQAIVFDGDWNGGERTFNLRARQSLQFQSIKRVANGAEVPLVAGDLSKVDQYKFTSSSVLRWRSRLPDDKAFENKEITYVIDYTLSGVLRHTGSRYVLDHDFAFPDRAGPIELYSLRLDLDPVWRGSQSPILVTRKNLAPGESVVVSLALEYTGAGAPAAAVNALSPLYVDIILALFALALVSLAFNFVMTERAKGRFAPVLPPPDAINEAWLTEHLFVLKPEAAGTAIDGKTGAPEVAAMLARMTQEKKIASSVETRKKLLSSHQVLSLELLAHRDALPDGERKLIDKFFFHGETTDTDLIREHYKASGFNPAKIVETAVGPELRHIHGWGKSVRRANWKIDIIALTVTLVLMIVAALAGGNDGGTVVAMIVMGGVLLAFAGLAANIQSAAVTGLALRFALPVLILAPFLVVVVMYARSSVHLLLHFLTPLAICAWAIAVTKLMLDLLRSAESPERIAFRKKLHAARNFFVAELRRPQPRLHDAWYPYLLAFGLGQHVDRWFSAFGTAAAAGSAAFAGSHSSFGSSDSSSSTSGFTGGGGAFGGAGASGGWAVAAAAMGAGVAAPSSSSGGGGGGGGGSSGGGGGGGW